MATNIQTNTFTKGMNFDTDITMLPNSQYRYAENIRIVTDDNGTSGVLQGIDTIRKYDTGLPEGHTVIGATSIENIMIIITRADTYNSIFVANVMWDLLNPEDIEYEEFVSAEFGFLYRVKVIANKESDDNIKIYFTDGVSQMKSLNIKSDKFKKDVSNPLYENGLLKNPELLDITPSAILPKVITNVTDGGQLTHGTIQYCYLMFMVKGQETALSPLSDRVYITSDQFITENSGNTEKDGQSTKQCNLIIPVNTETLDALLGFDKIRLYRLEYGEKGDLVNVHIVNELDLDILTGTTEITLIDTGTNIVNTITVDEFNSINSSQFTNYLIEKKDNRLFAANISEATFDVEYDARAYRGSILRDLQLGNILNIVLDSSIGELLSFTDVYGSGETAFNAFCASVPKTHDCINSSNSGSFSYDGLDYPAAFTKQWAIDFDGSNTDFYIGGMGLNVKYHFITADLPIENSQEDAGFLLRNDCAKYKLTGSSYYNNGLITVIDMKDDSTSTISLPSKDRATLQADSDVAGATVGYMRDEIYRFGIVFYNEKNIASPVHWIGDIRMPHASYSKFSPFQFEADPRDNDINHGKTHAKPLGIKFEINNIPDGVTAYEIVRCERTDTDKTIISQGVISSVFNYTNSTSDINVDDEYNLGGTTDIKPYVFLTRGGNSVGISDLSGAKTMFQPGTDHEFENKYVTFISPETVFYDNEYVQKIPRNAYLNNIYALVSPIEPKAFHGYYPYTMSVATNAIDSEGTSTYNDRDVFDFYNPNYLGMVQWQSQHNFDGYFIGINANLTSNVAKHYVPVSYDVDSHALFAAHANIFDVNIVDTLVPQNLEVEGITEKANYYKPIGDKSYVNQSYADDDTLAAIKGNFGPTIVLQTEQDFPTIKWFTSYDSLTNYPTYNDKLGYGAIVNAFTIKVSYSSFAPSIVAGSVYNNVSNLGVTRKYNIVRVVNDTANLQLIVTISSVLGVPSNDSPDDSEMFTLYEGIGVPSFTPVENSLVDLSASYTLNAIPVVNLRRDTMPYGGNLFVNRQNSTYISTASHATKTTGSSSDTMLVFGGDTFVGVLDYPTTTRFQFKDNTKEDENKVAMYDYIVLESTINLSLLSGDMASKTYSTDGNINTVNYNSIEGRMIVDAGAYAGAYNQDTPYYDYNFKYSADSKALAYVPLSIYADINAHYGNRIMYSELKINNEITDKWTKFKPANYLDTDTLYGVLTNLINFNGRMYYLQTSAFGVLSINERSLVLDNLGQLTLGVGGVLQRYDYISTTHGAHSINSKSLCQSDSAIYWFDYTNREICQYSQLGLLLLSKAKGMQSYLNGILASEQGSYYNSKFNEVLIALDNKKLVYNELVQQFTSFYTFNPDYVFKLYDNLVALDNLSFYNINKSNGHNDVDISSSIKFVINKDAMYTKVFDNVFYQGEFVDNTSIMTPTSFKTLRQESTETFGQDCREDTYRFAIGRDSNGYRLRGKWLICDYQFDNANGNEFSIPYINTTYRHSMI